MFSKQVMSLGDRGNIIVMLVALRSGIDFEISNPPSLAEPSKISRVNSWAGMINGVWSSRTNPCITSGLRPKPAKLDRPNSIVALDSVRVHGLHVIVTALVVASLAYVTGMFVVLDTWTNLRVIGMTYGKTSSKGTFSKNSLVSLTTLGSTGAQTIARNEFTLFYTAHKAEMDAQTTHILNKMYFIDGYRITKIKGELMLKKYDDTMKRYFSKKDEHDLYDALHDEMQSQIDELRTELTSIKDSVNKIILYLNPEANDEK